jgi:hypothetical protein
LEEASFSKTRVAKTVPSRVSRNSEIGNQNVKEIEKVGKHTFSIELKSKEYLKLITIPKDVEDTVSIEGFLGELEEIDLVEGVMLEIKGANGILRMDLTEEELDTLLKKGKGEQGRG